ncbi:hypothetical protein [Xenorhabdus griffiniae]|uniref:hypothetical protein n=1 Tax=Xenorhabdus griffiniae TaxID=351672 RepID=UPI0023590819|nr:hypothetical protein [Xenorhabdus griffiniae]MDC9605593.1 hypothetical protein [Xenorhabdus griffiniae]
MSVPKFNEVFEELMRYRNPSGTPVLQEVTHNGTKTLLIRFDDINARTSFADKTRLTTKGYLRRNSNSYSYVLEQLGFESTNPWYINSNVAKLEFRLTNHPGYDVTIHAYQNILLPSYSPEESSSLNLFKERLDENKRKYQNIRDSLRNYRSPRSSPAKSPQVESSGFFSAHNPPNPQYEQDIQQAIRESRITAYQDGSMPGTSNFLQTAQSGGPVRRLVPSTSQRSAPYPQPQRSSTPDPYAYQRGAPRPPSRPQTPSSPQPSTSSQPSGYSQRDAEYKRWFDEDDESWM